MLEWLKKVDVAKLLGYQQVDISSCFCSAVFVCAFLAYGSASFLSYKTLVQIQYAIYSSQIEKRKVFSSLAPSIIVM